MLWATYQQNLDPLNNRILSTVFAGRAPGPLHLDWPGEPFAAIAGWPVVWIPALLAPAAIFLHVVSIRQSLATGKNGRAG